MQSITWFANRWIYVLALIMAIMFLRVPPSIHAQVEPDGERTLERLLRRLGEVATDPAIYSRGTGVVFIRLTAPTADGERVLPIWGRDVQEYITYTFTRIEAPTFCVIANPRPRESGADERCFDFAQIAMIDSLDEDKLVVQEFENISDERQSPDLSGLLVRFRQLNDFRNQSPAAYTGYLLQFRYPILEDDPDARAVLVGVEFRGLGQGITRIGTISLQRDYLCMEIVRAAMPGAGVTSYSCIPYTNIASVRLLRNGEFSIDPEDYPDISEFLASEHGGTLISADTTTPPQPQAEVAAAISRWWQRETSESLTLRLFVPVDASGTQITIGRAGTTADAPYSVTEVGDGYLCLTPEPPDRRVASSDRLGELCVTFANVEQVYS